MIFGNRRRENVNYKIKPQVASDIRTLSELTGFSVDEIVCEALEQVLNDNKYSFVRMAVYDHFMPQFEDADEEYEPFELGGLRVEIKYVNDKYEVKSTIKDKENNLVDEYTKQFDDIFDDMEEWLKYLGFNINFGSDDVEEYLKERINYREIFIR